MVLGHPSRSALSTPPAIMSSRISTQSTTRHRRRGRAGRERHDVKSDDDGGCGSRARQSLRALVMQSSAPAPGAPSPWESVMGAIEDSNSQCTFLQMTYTAENPHADGSTAPGARPRLLPPRRRGPHATSPAPTTTGWQEDRCPVVSKRPLHSSRAAAKMSPAHPHRPGARPGRPCPVPACSGQPLAREDSAPHCGTEFS
jgi:hypothetical protein